METLEVRFKKIREDAVIPSYAHDGDLGMDMTATSIEYNAEMDCYIYGTSLAFGTDMGSGVLIFPRSSNRKTEAYLANSVGSLTLPCIGARYSSVSRTVHPLKQG